MKKAKKVSKKKSSPSVKRSEHGMSNECCSSSSGWMVASIVLGALLILSVILLLTGSSSKGLSNAQAEAKANEYVNLLSNPDMPLNVVSVVKENQAFRINIEVLGQAESWFMSLDGEKLFPSAFSLSDIRAIVGQQQLGEAQQQAPPPSQGEVSVNFEGANVLNPGQGVVMVEYSSVTCPFCARYNAETFPSIVEQYIETGRITYVYKHFIRNDVDVLAANAMECAGEQGRFFEYKEVVYANQNSLSQQALYGVWAGDLGLDTASFDECFNEMRYSSKASADTQEGQMNGVTGTPGFLVNSRLIAGAQPFQSFSTAIEAELAN